MVVEYSAAGIYLREIDLWLDPREPTAAAWISHAHSDHARGAHGNTFATPATLSIYSMRVELERPSMEGFRPLGYGESIDWNGARLTALPAAHIVGAAQLLVEYRGERLIYTGDIKLKAPLCGAATEITPCDHLIIESTFGLPIFHFLDRDEARRRILAFARECFDDGAIPAFLGYPLGRGQELVYVLAQGGVRTAVHGAIGRFLDVYRQAGYEMDCEPYDNKAIKGRAMVVVPGMRNVLMASGKNIRIAYMSGWAALSNARTSVGAEHLIPYSDHGGFEELTAIVAGTGEKRVDVVHGYTEAFARILTLRGIDARAVWTQLEAVQD